MKKPFKIPVSVLVVIYTQDRQVLLLERADHPGWWQSVTGSQEAGETLRATAVRELQEETGLAAHGLTDWRYYTDYEIFACYRHRYAPGTTRNREHVFGLELPAPVTVQLAPGEHLAQRWLPWSEAAEACFSSSNAAAIRRLGDGGARP
ncbi:MAG: dihydroneopterin triphosphate diphosphatase [Betaproteobacteria bacterium]|nr:dihydroneopterin triphosphate diphosphatase [Betaproteobacteria bacterium]